MESLDRRIETLEARMGVHGSRSSKTPQSNKWLVMIKETQKQLLDVMNALGTEVKDSIVTF